MPETRATRHAYPATIALKPRSLRYDHTYPHVYASYLHIVICTCYDHILTPITPVIFLSLVHLGTQPHLR
jgi:hypothetical protein